MMKTQEKWAECDHTHQKWYSLRYSDISVSKFEHIQQVILVFNPS